MKLRLKITALIAAALMILPVFPAFAAVTEADVVEPTDYKIKNEDDLPIKSENVLLYSEYDDRYLYKKNSEMSLEPGSTVKTLVGAMIYEKFRDRLDEKITVTEENLDGKEGLLVYFEAGEILSIRQLMYALLMYGANDAAVILVHHYMSDEEKITGDDLTDFVGKMNAKIKDLGCSSTVYKNVTGLHERGAKTILKDVIRIAAYAASLDGFTDFTSKDRYIIEETKTNVGRIILSRNHLVSTFRTSEYFTKGVTGMSYGATEETGECLVVSSEYGGKNYFIAIMGGYTDKETGRQVEFDDAIYLLEYAKTAFGYVEVLKKGTVKTQVKVTLGSTADAVTLIPTKSVTMFLPKNTNVKEEITYKTLVYESELEAPVREGDVAGELTVCYNGEDICKIPLVTSTSVERSQILFMLDRTKKFVTSTGFIAGAAAFFVLLIGYAVIRSAVSKRKQKKRKRLR
ncbi:MAG: D-alanyl-D-alanine carboxypeptidase [Clostridia bacterium]|nr:D-alanyl-D-alanine carboxypeptidase [Clostridia bacterium]MBQ3869850.1 D-alanyl-D-alanine carboxypeptidase [Clostridia bacterium]